MNNASTLDNLDVMNPAPRCPVTLLLDVSSSMAGQPIEELNDAVAQFIRETQGDEAASMSVELEIITFADSAAVALPFTPLFGVMAEQTTPVSVASDRVYRASPSPGRR